MRGTIVIVGSSPAYEKEKYMKPTPPARPATVGSSSGAPSWAVTTPAAASPLVSSALSWWRPPPNLV
jgi:hypothetical protein